MKAGHESVRPHDRGDFDIAPFEGSEDGDDEGVMGEPRGEEVERLGLPIEGDFLRKLADPKLPSGDEVERHRVAGHIPYRNWCPICVLKPRGKTWIT